jgi:shikimate dehydrogenase
MSEINGATRLYAIIGDPIVQVGSPRVFNALFRQHGIDAVLVPVQIAPADLAIAVAGLKRLLNLDGIIVTVPHKMRMLEFADEVMPTGARVGAINALRRGAGGRWIGDMFDGKGFVAGLRDQGHEPKGKAVLLVGAGGAGSAVAYALAEAGAARLTISDVDATKAARLAVGVAAAYPVAGAVAGPPEPEGHDIVVNATPLGMAPGDALPLDVTQLRAGMLVADVVIKAEATALLAEAQRLGCQIHGGRHMLNGQAKAVFGFFGFGS